MIAGVGRQSIDEQTNAVDVVLLASSHTTWLVAGTTSSEKFPFSVHCFVYLLDNFVPDSLSCYRRNFLA